MKEQNGVLRRVCVARRNRDRRAEKEDIYDFITWQRLSSEAFLRPEPLLAHIRLRYGKDAMLEVQQNNQTCARQGQSNQSVYLYPTFSFPLERKNGVLETPKGAGSIYFVNTSSCAVLANRQHQHLATTNTWATLGTCAILAYVQYSYLSNTGSWPLLGTWAVVGTCKALPLPVSLAAIANWFCHSPIGARLGFTIPPSPHSQQPEPGPDVIWQWKWPCWHLAIACQ